MLITLKYESVDMRVYNIYKLDMHLTKYATAYYRRSKALDSEEYLLSCIEFNTDVTVKGIGVFGVDWVSHRSIDEFSETLRDLVLLNSIKKARPSLLKRSQRSQRAIIVSQASTSTTIVS